MEKKRDNQVKEHHTLRKLPRKRRLPPEAKALRTRISGRTVKNPAERTTSQQLA